MKVNEHVWGGGGGGGRQSDLTYMLEFLGWHVALPLYIWYLTGGGGNKKMGVMAPMLPVPLTVPPLHRHCTMALSHKHCTVTLCHSHGLSIVPTQYICL